MQVDRETFGPRLRRERERRGIALKDIAELTKLKESLFVELERNDFSKWPQGIFRRAHLCAYVSAIGLPPQPVLADYLRLFPEDPPVDQSDNPEVSAVAGICQVPQTPKPSGATSPPADRTWVVFFDLALVCLMSSVLAGILRVSLWPAIALVGLGYSAGGTVWVGESIGTYVQRRISASRHAQSQPQVPLKTPLREVQLVASRRTRSTFSQGDISCEREVEEQRASA